MSNLIIAVMGIPFLFKDAAQYIAAIVTRNKSGVSMSGQAPEAGPARLQCGHEALKDHRIRR